MVNKFRAIVFWAVICVGTFFGLCAVGMETASNVANHRGYWSVTGLAALWILFLVGVLVFAALLVMLGFFVWDKWVKENNR